MSTSATRSNVHHTKEQQQEAEKRILEWRSDELTRGRAESEIYSSESIMNMKTVAKLAENLVASYAMVPSHSFSMVTGKSQIRVDNTGSSRFLSTTTSISATLKP